MFSFILTPVFLITGAGVVTIAGLLFLANLRRTKNAKAAIAATQASAKDVVNAVKQEFAEANDAQD
jgi:hypothetical protein